MYLIEVLDADRGYYFISARSNHSLEILTADTTCKIVATVSYKHLYMYWFYVRSSYLSVQESDNSRLEMSFLTKWAFVNLFLKLCACRGENHPVKMPYTFEEKCPQSKKIPSPREKFTPRYASLMVFFSHWSTVIWIKPRNFTLRFTWQYDNKIHE